MTAAPPAAAVSVELVRGARRLRRHAVRTLLEAYYPLVYRMAYGLCGRPATGNKALRLAMRQCIRVLPLWNRDDMPEQWFPHHTLLICRRVSRKTPDASRDVLVAMAETDDPAYIAFIRAVRSLPMQQREAFILHHGEGLGPRELGITMDCSVEAARAHLNAAARALADISGGGPMDELTRRMAKAYARLTPSEALVIPEVRHYMRRHYWPQRIARTVHRFLTLALWGAGLWAICHLLLWANRYSH